MRRDESFQDYMRGYRAGLSGRADGDGEVVSDRAWAEGFDAGRAARAKAERAISLEYVGLGSIRVDRQDLLA